MAQNKQLSFLVLLLLVSFLQIQCIVGRPLILDQKETGTEGNKAAVANTQSLAPPSPPTPSVVVGATETPPPKNANDFRPTAPGHSPGVGHSLQN
ncbi:hypothetical protein PVK06_006104 [Gossypium arboreum]|uniref:Uncharacterized protein n=1 Tax=Gossypium arboreum TaxID=29729 RepID=A0ABR0QWE9_GOSAR|nr:hypothetical protein PVK06_006104 [Gossypium arboreum]